jgi:DNA-binding CsgD family transcriptional regulator
LRIPDGKLFAVIETIYRAPLDPGAWQDVVEDIQALLPMTGASLQGFHAGSPPRTIGVFAGYDPDSVEQYVAHYAAHNPWVPLVPKMPAGVPVVVDESPFAPQVRKTEFHHFLVKRGLGSGIGLPIWNTPDRVFMFAIDYSVSKGAKLNGPASNLAGVLAPHLRRSFEIAHKLAEAQAATAEPAALLARMKTPALVVDRCRRLRFANEAAELLLRSQVGLHLDRAGRVILREVSADVELEKSVQACFRPELTGSLPHAIAFRTTEGEWGRWISAIPLATHKKPSKADIAAFLCSTGSLAMLIVSQARESNADSTQVLRTAFRLTPSETKLALALMHGSSLQEHARENGVAVMTVRNQLQSIFGKTSTHRQAELIALLFRALRNRRPA